MTFRIRGAAALALLAIAAIFGVGCGSSDSDTETTDTASAASPQIPPPKGEPPVRIAVLVLENREYGEVIGNEAMPFLNELAESGVLATRYYAIAHPSLVNYLAIVGGSTFGIEENCEDCFARGDSLAAQLSRAGLTWRGYMEDMPEACFEGDAHDGYVKKHNPFMYFPDITSDPDLCANVVPATQLDVDMAADSLPAFSWIGPNLCHDAHDCTLEEADSWLSELVPRVEERLGPGGFLVITFDEGESDAGCCGVARGGRIATILVGPGVRAGVPLDRPVNHYSLLATIEDIFGLPRLRHARDAQTLNEALKG
jgi:hypothetical protein